MFLCNVRPRFLPKNLNHVRKVSLNAAINNASGKDDKSLWVGSPFPEVKTVVGLTVPELMREVRGPWGKLPAFDSHETGQMYTHDQILHMSRGFAAALIQSGFKKREVIAMILPNVPEFAIVLYGIWDAGLVGTPCNPAYGLRELNMQVQLSEAVGVVVTPPHVPLALQMKKVNSKIRSVIVLGDAPQGCHSFYQMVKADTMGIEFFKGSSVDTKKELALLPFSSGTTGPPKGVMLSHSNLTTNVMQCDPATATGMFSFRPSSGTSQERFLGVLPFFHTYGMSASLFQAMQIGAHVRCFTKFEPMMMLKGVREHKPTVWHLVTPLISHIANWAEYGKSELDSARVIIGGAAPIGPALISQLCEKAGKHLVFQEGYGMTETSPVTHVLDAGSNNNKIGSCGRPVPSTMTKLVNVDGNTVGRNIRGELCIKGPQVMLGYFKNEEATRDIITSDGWLYTGDIGKYDDDGYLWIVDRVKELIKVQGFQVAPSELEDLLRKHDKISDVAVIGIPHEQTGETPRAYIVKKPQTELSENDVHDYMKDLVSKHKLLKGGVEFIDEIPKANTGKILRRVLKDKYMANLAKQKK